MDAPTSTHPVPDTARVARRQAELKAIQAGTLEEDKLRLLIQKAFCRVFELDEVDPNDKFFEFGGDSLLSELLSLEIKRVTGVEFPPGQLFESESPAEIAKWVIKDAAHRQALFPDQNENPARGKLFAAKKLIKRIDSAVLGNFGRRVVSYARKKRENFRQRNQTFDAELCRRMNLLYVNGWHRNGKNGTLIDSPLPILRLNHDGKKVPIFWCFNGYKGPVNLAEAMGPDQPINAFISLANLHLAQTVKRRLEPELGKAYAHELEKLYPSGDIIIGGNCQGGRVAEATARELFQRGRNVALLCLLEYLPSTPYPGRLVFFFGSESPRHNPFLTRLPEEIWRKIHNEVAWDIVPGRHTKFFTRPNVTPFAAALTSRLDELRRNHE